MNIKQAKEILEGLEMDHNEFLSKEDVEAFQKVYFAVDLLEKMLQADDCNIYFNEVWKLFYGSLSDEDDNEKN